MIAMLALLLALVNSPVNSVPYACDGSTAVYAITFPYLDFNDLKVTTTTAGGVSTTLVYTTDFTVNFASTSTTATLTLTSPLAKCPVGNTLKITRSLALTQPSSFRAQTNYDQTLHEKSYDRAVMQIQQIAGGLEAIGFTGAGSGIITGTLGIGFGGNGFVGFLPQTSGGTGSGSLTCLPGQTITSNGTAYSCAYLVESPVLGGKRTNLWIISDGSASGLTSSAGGPAVSTQGAGVWSNDQASDTTRDMLKVSIAAQQVGSIGAVANTVATMPQWLPKLSARVYVPITFTGQTTAYHKLMVGLNGQGRGGDSNTGTCQSAFSSVPDQGAWFCLTDNTGSAVAGAYRWVICTSNGTGACLDSGVNASIGAHLLSVDFASFPNSITWTIDNTSITRTPSDLSSTFPVATQALSPSFVTATGISATATTYSLSGFQLTQDF